MPIEDTDLLSVYSRSNQTNQSGSVLSLGLTIHTHLTKRCLFVCYSLVLRLKLKNNFEFIL